MEDKRVTRRDFLLRVGAFGLAGLGAGSLLSACGGGQQQEAAQQGAAQQQPAASGEAASGELSCMDVSGLTAEQIQMRESLQYTDHSPEPGKHCHNCQLFVAPENPNQCGTCQLVPGPIHPDGYCTSWVQKAT